MDIASLRQNGAGNRGAAPIATSPRQTGKSNEKRFDFLTVRGDSGGEHALQNSAVVTQTAGAGVALLFAEAVEQNFLLIFQLRDVLFGFLFLKAGPLCRR